MDAVDVAPVKPRPPRPKRDGYVLATVAIVNISQNPRTLVRLEGAVLDYLGKLSYGTYVFHLVAVTVAIRALLPLHPTSGVAEVMWGVAVDAVAMAGSIAIAAVSYGYFESYFLAQKARFSTLISGDLAKLGRGSGAPKD